MIVALLVVLVVSLLAVLFVYCYHRRTTGDLRVALTEARQARARADAALDECRETTYQLRLAVIRRDAELESKR